MFFKQPQVIKYGLRFKLCAHPYFANVNQHCDYELVRKVPLSVRNRHTDTQELGIIKHQDSSGGNVDNFIHKKFSGRIPFCTMYSSHQHTAEQNYKTYHHYCPEA